MILGHVSSKEWGELPELIYIYQEINPLIKYSIWWIQVAGIEEREHSRMTLVEDNSECFRGCSNTFIHHYFMYSDTEVVK